MNKPTSYSRLKRYLDCPLSYKLYYLEGRPEPVGDAAIEGREEHEALAQYAIHCIDNKIMTDLDWIRSYPASSGAREVLDACADTLMFEPGTYYIEDRIELELAAEYPFVAIIDLLKLESDRLIIRDYKSDRRIRTATEVNGDLQGKVYACLAADRNPGRPEYVFEMYFIRYGVSRQVVYTADDIPKLREEMMSLADRMNAEQEYEARPGPRCDWCAFKRDCPQCDPEAVVDDEDAEAKAARLIALKAAVKSAEDYLKPHCSKDGPIQVNGLEVGFFRTESYEYPDRLALEKVLCEYVQNGDRFWKADTAAIKKAAARDDMFQAALADIAVDKSTTRFTTRKAKGEAA